MSDSAGMRGVVALTAIEGARTEHLDEAVVAQLVESLPRLGLLNPVVISRGADGKRRRLVAGHHRVEAARRLGMTDLPCVFLPADASDPEQLARMAEIAENLHRREISAPERRDLIRAWAEIVREREAAELQSRTAFAIESKRADGRGHRPEGVAAKVARETGYSQRTVQKALAPEREPEPDLPVSAPAPTQEFDRIAAFKEAEQAKRDEFRSAWKRFHALLDKYLRVHPDDYDGQSDSDIVWELLDEIWVPSKWPRSQLDKWKGVPPLEAYRYRWIIGNFPIVERETDSDRLDQLPERAQGPKKEKARAAARKAK